MLDIKIVFITNTIALFILSIYMMLRHRNNIKNRSIKFVTYFIVLYFLGFILLLLRNTIPDFLSILLANSFFVTGSISLYVAVRAILKFDASWHYRYWIPVVVLFLGMGFFTYLDYNTNARIIIYFGFCMLFAFLPGWLFWNHASKRFYYFDKISAMMFFADVVLCFLIILRAGFIQLEVNYLSITDTIIILPSIFMSVLILWLVLLTNYRLNNTD